MLPRRTAIGQSVQHLAPAARDDFPNPHGAAPAELRDQPKQDIRIMRSAEPAAGAKELARFSRKRDRSPLP